MLKVSLSDTALIALTSFFAYCLVYSFEAGFLDYFAIPNSFIELSIERVFSSAALLLPLLFCINLVFTMRDLKKDAKKITAINALIVIVCTIYILFQGFLFGGSTVSLMQLPTEIMLIVFVLVLIFCGMSPKGRARMLSFDEGHARKFPLYRIAYWLGARSVMGGLTTILASVFFIYFSFPFGSATASREHYFWITSLHGKEFAFVRKYGEVSILVPIIFDGDDETKFNFACGFIVRDVAGLEFSRFAERKSLPSTSDKKNLRYKNPC